MDAYIKQLIKDREKREAQEKADREWNKFLTEDAIGQILAAQAKNQKNLAA